MSLKPQCPENYILNKDNCRCRKKKKCPRGTRKNKETGECESKNMQKTKKSKKTEIITKTPASNLFSDDTIKISKKKTKKTTKKKTPSNTFKKLTGYGVIVNTSFNVRGEPIVCTPYDAYRCFMSTEMDYLVINNFLYMKRDQNDWENKEKWKVKFKLD